MKRLLLTFIIALTASLGWSQCSISYSWTVSGDTVTLTPIDSSSGNGHIQWTAAGGGIPSSQTLAIGSPAYVLYNTAGTYTVCAILHDTATNCIDTFCDQVTVGGSSSSLSVTNIDSAPACGACDGQIYALVSGGVSPYTYLWSNASTSVQPTNLCPGAYTVTVTDANGTTATASSNLTTVGNMNAAITVSDSTPCVGDTVTLSASATSTGGPLSFLWATGEITPSIQVAQSGTYTVTIADSNGCQDITAVTLLFNTTLSVSASATNVTCSTCCDGTATASVNSSGSFSYVWSNSATGSAISSLCPGTYTVTVTNGGCSGTASATVAPYTCANVSGIVAQGYPARVYLIQENSGFLTAVDSVLVDTSGIFLFSSVCPGTYYLKGALMPSHPSYLSYLPTYYDSAALWSGATGVVLSGSSIAGIAIDLLSGTNTGGAGFIGGLISQGANRSEGDPVIDAQVVLYDEAGNVSAFAKSDANGEYSFNNIALGTYTIHVDILNKTSYPHSVTLDAENTEEYGRNFTVTETIIKPATPSGVEAIADMGIHVYPNPVEDVLTIRQDEVQLQTLTLFNLTGERVMHVNVGPQDVIELEMGTLAQGPYILEMRGASFAHHQSIIVK